MSSETLFDWKTLTALALLGLVFWAWRKIRGPLPPPPPAEKPDEVEPQ